MRFTLLAAVLLIALVGCGNKHAATKEAPVSPADAARAFAAAGLPLRLGIKPLIGPLDFTTYDPSRASDNRLVVSVMVFARIREAESWIGTAQSSNIGAAHSSAKASFVGAANVVVWARSAAARQDRRIKSALAKISTQAQSG